MFQKVELPRLGFTASSSAASSITWPSCTPCFQLYSGVQRRVSVKYFQVQCLPRGLRFGRSVSWDASVQWVPTLCVHRSDSVRATPGFPDVLVPLQASKPWSGRRKQGPSRPPWMAFLMCFPSPTPDWAVWLQEQRSHWSLLIVAAEGLAAALHTGGFLDSEALETQG